MAASFEDLPKPLWIDEDDLPSKEEFPKWSKEDTLTFIIGQKYSSFPMLKSLPRIRDDEEVPDLFTIESRISGGGYGPIEILEDLTDLQEYIKELYEHKKVKRHQVLKLRRSAAELFRCVRDELEKFDSCSDCVAHYYNTNDYFTVPCTNVHSIVYVKNNGVMWPAKTLQVRNDKVLVAYFGRYGRKNFVHLHEWVSFHICIMASNCFRYKIANSTHLDSLIEMAAYVQMIARKHKLYYKGFPCPNGTREAIRVFTPDLLTMPSDLLVPDPPGHTCKSCYNPIQAHVNIQLGKRRPSNRGFFATRLDPNSLVICGRPGCKKKATQECFFCNQQVFCSTLCSHEDYQRHALECSKNKIRHGRPD